MNRKSLISVDVGASSGKMARFFFDGRTISMEDVIEFDNKGVAIRENLYWNVLGLYSSMLDGFAKFSDRPIDSVAIDTWGASFGLLNRRGQLAEPVYHYRDLQTLHALEDMHNIVSKRDIFRLTGCQPSRMFSLPQLFTMAQRRDEILDIADKLLFLPDLFSYFLCGEVTSERTLAGTSALLTADQSKWCIGLLRTLGIPTHFLTEMIEPGCVKGPILPVVCASTGLSPTVKVVAAASHDTAAGVLAIPNFSSDDIYIGSGTNINMGMECDFHPTSDAYFTGGFKNTAGMSGTNLVYLDFATFWFVNGLRASWARRGIVHTHERLTALAREADNKSYIALDDPVLNQAEGDMSEKIRDFLTRTGQRVPETEGEFLRCVYDSVALKVKHTVMALSAASEKAFRVINIINGGARNTLLNQLIADATGHPVRAGLPNASLVGNALSQLAALGEVHGLSQIRELSAASFQMQNYLPEPHIDWNEARAICQLKGILN